MHFTKLCNFGHDGYMYNGINLQVEIKSEKNNIGCTDA